MKTSTDKMAPHSRNRGLALDLDGTLLDSMQFHAQAWKQAFHELGLDVPLDWFLVWEGVNARGVIQLVLAALGIELSTDDRQRICDLKHAYYDELFHPLPNPGLQLLYNALKELRYPIAVVTGSEHEVARRVLTSIDFIDVVGLIVGGDDVSPGKPAPDPYLYAVRGLQIQKSHCLVLENAPEGIKSALAAAITCVAVETTLPAEQLRGADRLVRDLPAFTDLLFDEYRRSGGVGIWQI